MMWDQWLVTGFGAVLIVLIVWFFWFKSLKGTRAEVKEQVQKAFIVVKGGYTPDTIVVQHGKPLRLYFRRDEVASCSERVVFPDFNVSATLPTGVTTPLDIFPDKPGEYEFACQMGMLRGRLIVE